MKHKSIKIFIASVITLLVAVPVSLLIPEKAEAQATPKLWIQIDNNRGGSDGWENYTVDFNSGWSQWFGPNPARTRGERGVKGLNMGPSAAWQDYNKDFRISYQTAQSADYCASVGAQSAISTTRWASETGQSDPLPNIGLSSQDGGNWSAVTSHTGDVNCVRAMVEIRDNPLGNFVVSDANVAMAVDGGSCGFINNVGLISNKLSFGKTVEGYGGLEVTNSASEDTLQCTKAYLGVSFKTGGPIGPANFDISITPSSKTGVIGEVLGWLVTVNNCVNGVTSVNLADVVTSPATSNVIWEYDSYNIPCNGAITMYATIGFGAAPANQNISVSVTADALGVYKTAYTNLFISVSTPPPVSLMSINLLPDSWTMGIGATKDFTVTATFSDGTTRDVTATSNYVSNSPSIANWFGNGIKWRAIGVAAGSTGMRAEYTENGVTRTDTSTMTITGPSEAINCPSSSIFLVAGQSASLAYSIVNSSNNVPIVWNVGTTSGPGTLIPTPPNGVMVSPNFNVTVFVPTSAGTTPGTYNLRFTGTRLSTTFTCNTLITVSSGVSLVSITLTPSAQLVPGEQVVFTTRANYSNGTSSDVSNSAIYFVESGSNALSLFGRTGTAIQAGTAVVSSTYLGMNREVTIQVMDFTLTCPASQNIAFGTPSVNFTFSLNRLNGFNKNFNYSLAAIGSLPTTSTPSLPHSAIWSNPTYTTNLSVSTASLPSGTYTIQLSGYYSNGIVRSATPCTTRIVVGTSPDFQVEVIGNPVKEVMRAGSTTPLINEVDYAVRAINCTNMAPGQIITFSPSLGAITGVTVSYPAGGNAKLCNEIVYMRLTANASAGPVDVNNNNPPQMGWFANGSAVIGATTVVRQANPAVKIFTVPEVPTLSFSPAPVDAGVGFTSNWTTNGIPYPIGGFPGGNFCQRVGDNPENKWNGVLFNDHTENVSAINTAGFYNLGVRCYVDYRGGPIWSATRTTQLQVLQVVPNPPTLTNSSTSCTGVTINWDQPSGGAPIVNYQVYRNGVAIGGLLGSGARSYFDGTPLASATYTVRSVASGNVQSNVSNSLIVGWNPCEPSLSASNKRVLEVNGVANPYAVQNPCDPSYSRLDLKARLDQNVRFLINVCNTGTGDLNLTASDQLVINDNELTHLKKPTAGWRVRVQGQDCVASPGWSVGGATAPQCQFVDNAVGLTIRLRNAVLSPGGNWQVSFDGMTTVGVNENGTTFFYRNKGTITYPKNDGTTDTKQVDTGFKVFTRGSDEGVKLIEIPPGM